MEFRIYRYISSTVNKSFRKLLGIWMVSNPSLAFFATNWATLNTILTVKKLSAVSNNSFKRKSKFADETSTEIWGFHTTGI
jgi:hypothetical protein